MKRFLPVVIAFLLCAIGMRSQAATVTFTLEINPAANSWSLFGDDSNDNGGISLWFTSISNINFPVNIQAPFLRYQDNSTLDTHGIGFYSPFLEDNGANPFGTTQEDMFVHGFGQTGGTLTLPPNSALTGGRQFSYAAHLLLAEGTYSGALPAFTPSTSDDGANVFADAQSTDQPIASVAFNTVVVPEPAMGMGILAPALLLLNRRRAV